MVCIGVRTAIAVKSKSTAISSGRAGERLKAACTVMQVRSGTHRRINVEGHDISHGALPVICASTGNTTGMLIRIGAARRS